MPAAGQRKVSPLARKVAAHFAAPPEVVAVAVTRESATGADDANSDADLYVYAAPAATGTAQADARSISAAGGGNQWSAGGAPIPLSVHLMYRTPGWIADQPDRVFVLYEASRGYNSCLWHTVRESIPLFDRDVRFARRRETAAVPYPEPLRHAIVDPNRPPPGPSIPLLAAPAIRARR